MYFDTHAHYDDSQFDKDRDALLSGLGETGVSLVVNPGCNLASSEAAVRLSERYDFLYAAVGYHPHDARLMDDSSAAVLAILAKNKKVVAIGEIGLDYHYDNSPRDVQRLRFREQLELSRTVGLPVIVHEREAAADCIAIVRDYADVPGVLHCFSGSLETAKRYIEMGWYLSFTGVITYKTAKRALEVIKWMPQDRLMLETDAPYLSPEPVRGKRNSSHNLPHIAEAVAAARGLTREEAAAITMENGKRFFGIG